MDGLPNKASRLVTWCRNQRAGRKAALFPAVTLICVVSLYAILDTFSWQPTVKKGRERLEMRVSSTTLQHEDVPSVPARGPAVPLSKCVQYPDRQWQGYPLPVMTSKPLGRLGNVMGEYASLWALRRIYNVTALVMPSMRARLRFFPSLSLPDLPGTYLRSEWHGVGKTGGMFRYNYTRIELAAAGLLGPHLFTLTYYPFEIHLFNLFKKELRREFTFAKGMQKKVTDFLSSVQQKWQSVNNSTTPPALVGFHIRRTDYLKYAMRNFGAKLPEDKYFTRALGHYRRRFSNNVAFVVASDDMAFAKQRLAHHRDVFFSKGGAAADDMALLSSCNHSIITLGSFGFWTGYLAGGEVVYPDVKLQRRYRFSRAMFESANLTNFIPLSAE